MIVSDHLNKIQAGKKAALDFPRKECRDQNSVEHITKKTAIICICLGLGLIKISELAAGACHG
jgi:hypothetical protein